MSAALNKTTGMISVIVASPNELAVISGVGYGTHPRLVTSGSAFVVACLHRVLWLPLEVMTVIIESPRVYTSHGVPISVTGVAQVNNRS